MCVSARVSQKPQVQTSPNFLCPSLVTVAPLRVSSFDATCISGFVHDAIFQTYRLSHKCIWRAVLHAMSTRRAAAVAAAIFPTYSPDGATF